MTAQALTLADIMTLIALIGVVAGVVRYVQTAISEAKASAAKDAAAVIQSLHEYKLEVAKTYATNGFIRDVEARLGQRFDAIVNELHGLRGDLQEAMLELAKSQPVAKRRT